MAPTLAPTPTLTLTLTRTLTSIQVGQLPPNSGHILLKQCAEGCIPMYPSATDASEYAPQTAAAIKLVQLVAASPQPELHVNGSGKVSLAASPIERCFLPFLSSHSFVPSLDAD